MCCDTIAMAVDDASTTTSSAAQDSDLDPAAFLKSVRELSDKRDREDVERFRQLEEKVQKEREERAARRAGVFEFHLVYNTSEMLWRTGCSINNASSRSNGRWWAVAGNTKSRFDHHNNLNFCAQGPYH